MVIRYQNRWGNPNQFYLLHLELVSYVGAHVQVGDVIYVRFAPDDHLRVGEMIAPSGVELHALRRLVSYDTGGKYINLSRISTEIKR